MTTKKKIDKFVADWKSCYGTTPSTKEIAYGTNESYANVYYHTRNKPKKPRTLLDSKGFSVEDYIGEIVGIKLREILARGFKIDI